MKSFSLLLIFQILFAVIVLVLDAAAAPSIDDLMGQIMPTVNKYRRSRDYLSLDSKIASDIRYLFKSSPIEFLEMLNSFSDVGVSELVFCCLVNDKIQKYFIFGNGCDLFCALLENVSRVVWKLFKSTFVTISKTEKNFNAIEMIIRITRKNIVEAKKQMIINRTLAIEMIKMENTMKNWEYTIRYCSFDPISGAIDFGAFSHLFDQIMSFSLQIRYNENNEKYYFLFKVYLTHLWKSNLKGLYEAPVRNLSALLSYLYNYWEIRVFDNVYTFLYFKTLHLNQSLEKIGFTTVGVGNFFEGHF
jgi:hypothetical protein